MAKLPPGKTGLPLVGKTFDFLKDPFGLILNGAQTHGPVYRTSILGEDILFITGPAAAELWLNEECLTRQKAQPPHVQSIFGAEDVLPLLDGEAHAQRREYVLAAFTREALAGYLPEIEATLAERFAAWAKAPQPLEGVTSLKKIALEVIGRNILGLSPGPELEALIDLYMQTDGALTCLPIPLPGTLFSQMRKAVKAILERLHALGESRRLNPGTDAFSRILSAQDEKGQRLPIAKAALETHHCILGGYIIWGALAMILKQLAEDQNLREVLLAEVMAISPSGQLTPKILAQLSQTLNFILEIKRTTPIVPGQFARARKTFEFQGYTIPKGVRVFLGIHASGQNPEIFAQPTTFDPARYNPERNEHNHHPHGFIPQGVGGDRQSHRCPGMDYSTVIMQVFVVLLLRAYNWSLPKQNLEYNWGLIPPEPQDGLRLQFASKDV